MIVKRTWMKQVRIGIYKYYTGYFLLGFIPLYISREFVSKV